MDTISESYRQQQQTLHRNPNYGVASLQFAPIVATIMTSCNIETLSDYGAGKQHLLHGLADNAIIPESYTAYDPAFPEYGQPMAAQLVCCIDVLEHIEPMYLDAVLEELARITVNIGFFTIHRGPAAKTLEDGRNAHLIQAPISWWLARLVRHFEIEHMESHNLMGPGTWMIVRPRETTATIEGNQIQI
ncbi:hypothetical protein KBY76_14010 [Synechococcus sp. GreenBA-s]|nr:hypothetical protein [Synechococcus sp. GreenBA-s]